MLLMVGLSLLDDSELVLGVALRRVDRVSMTFVVRDTASDDECEGEGSLLIVSDGVGECSTEFVSELLLLSDRGLLYEVDMVIEKVLVKVARSSFEGVLIREWETDNNV